jgi:hypothetical protein
MFARCRVAAPQLPNSGANRTQTIPQSQAAEEATKRLVWLQFRDNGVSAMPLTAPIRRNSAMGEALLSA